MMVAATKFEIFSENLAEKVHNLDTDTIKIYLSNTAPNVATNAVKADLAEITNQNGYTAPVDTQNATSRSGGTTTVTAVDIVITASGGSFGPFQYVVLYNDTPASPLDPLIFYWNYGSAISVNDTETFTVDFGSNSLMTIA
jgi:1-deoxy-D-xylulose 5-phosphate reductoisomerase